MHPNNLGCKEIYRLTKHPSLSLDTTDPPTHYTQTINHRRVRVGPDERIWEINTAAFQDTFRKILQINLMHDSNTRRNHSKRLESLLTPLQQLVTLAVAFELQIKVLRKSRG